jgi:hypothetical protein
MSLRQQPVTANVGLGTIIPNRSLLIHLIAKSQSWTPPATSCLPAAGLTVRFVTLKRYVPHASLIILEDTVSVATKVTR